MRLERSEGEDMGGNMQFLRCTVEMREINIGETSGEQQQKKDSMSNA